MDRAAASTSIDGGQGSNDSGMIGEGLADGTGRVEEGVTASAASIESVKGGEMLMDALDLVHNELAAIAERTANTTTSNTTKQHRFAHSTCLFLRSNYYLIGFLITIFFF